MKYVVTPLYEETDRFFLCIDTGNGLTLKQIQDMALDLKDFIEVEPAVDHPLPIIVSDWNVKEDQE